MPEYYVEWQFLKNKKDGYNFYYIDELLKYSVILCINKVLFISDLYKGVDIEDINDFETNYKQDSIKVNNKGEVIYNNLFYER